MPAELRDSCHPYGRKRRRTKELLDESEKVGLKLNIQNMKVMESGPITSWQIDGETMETVINYFLGGSKITADGDFSHEIKRHLLLGRKAMTNLDSILKRRGGVRRGVRASGSYQEGTGKSGSYGMWNHPRGHVWNVFVRPASS